MSKAKAPSIVLPGVEDQAQADNLFDDVAGNTPTQETPEPSRQPDDQTAIQPDRKTTRRLDRKMRKVSWNLEESLVDRLKRTKLQLELEGLDVDQQAIVAWGLEKALESIERGGECRKWLERRAGK